MLVERVVRKPDNVIMRVPDTRLNNGRWLPRPSSGWWCEVGCRLSWLMITTGMAPVKSVTSGNVDWDQTVVRSSCLPVQALHCSQHLAPDVSFDRPGRYETVHRQRCQRLLVRLRHVGLHYPSLMRPEATLSLHLSGY